MTVGWVAVNFGIDINVFNHIIFELCCYENGFIEFSHRFVVNFIL